MTDQHNDFATEGVAIIGLSLHFPGARSAEQFWENLHKGVESISVWKEEELLRAGVDAQMLRDPNYVPAAGMIDGVASFDAEFFDCTPREAELMDPQHRHFLECAWEALEDAGCDPSRYPGRIGVFAGAGTSGYLLNIQAAYGLPPEQILQLSMGSFSDYLTTRLSYKLDLRGPSMAVQTACSTSLVAVHLACLHLLAGQCEVALAGGVTLRAAEAGGYLYQEGGIFSPDGHCRPFDARARGTVEGNGVGVVVLKRLVDALADGDPIRAVIRGTAINNDGAQKAGFTAPSVQGQSEVIALAQAMAEVDPETITYIEAHGTGTPLGDPIEVAAICQAFQRRTQSKGFCALGSVKGNLGHLDAAAGVAGLIKTVLALQHRQLPPTLHLEFPNPNIDFERSPLRLQTALTEWRTPGFPRRAGVSSFGIGGTNAHVVLEEAPPLPREPALPARPWLLVLSARSTSALERMSHRLAEYMHHHELDLAGVSHTLMAGRRLFPHRRALVCQDLTEAVAALEGAAPHRVYTAVQESTRREVVFLFPGQGAQRVNMARGLYEQEPVFRQQVDRCAELLRLHLDGMDLRATVFPEPARREQAEAELLQTRLAQPALFTIEVALADLLERWGVRPAAMIGHSLGEYVAAYRAGVFSLEDALRMVAMRGALMQRLPTGGMLSVQLPAHELEPLLGPQLSLAAVNGLSLSVAAGPHEALDQLREQLAACGVHSTLLRTSHAFHSWMVEPALAPFAAELRRLRLRPPTVPFISNLSGTWIRPEDATDPHYWTRHLRETVRFGDGLRQLFQQPDRVLLEVGPGNALSTLALRHPERPSTQPVVSLMYLRHSSTTDLHVATEALGRLWAEGVPVDPVGYHGGAPPRRVSLPTYPFERRRYWIDPPRGPRIAPPAAARPEPEDHASGPRDPSGRARPPLEVPYVAPRTAIERRVADIWRECFGYAEIGVDDDLFALGGDSLLATQLLARLRETMAPALSMRELFDTPTIAGIARRISTNSEPAAPNAEPEESPRGQDTHPLSFTQQRLWVIEQLLPMTAAHHLSQCVLLRGPLNSDALSRALEEVARRHEVLRTTFHIVEGEPVQHVTAPSQVSFRRLDLRDRPEREVLAREHAFEESLAPFDLERGPLFRALLIVLSATEHLLMLTMHHLVADGWSMGVLLNELTTHYMALLQTGRAAALPALPLQYGDYARRQRAWLKGPVLEAQLAWWRQQLAGLRPLDLLTDRPRPATQSLHGAMHTFAFSEEQTHEVEAFSRSQGLTPFMTFLSAFSVLLGRYARQKDVTVGTPVAGRNRTELEGIIGMFVNTLVLPVDLSGRPTGSELLRRVREITLGAQAHQDVPFEKLVAALEPQRDLSRTPLFQVMFSLEAGTLERTRVGDLELERVPLAGRTAQFDLTLVLTRHARGYSGAFEYCADLFEPATVAALARRFTQTTMALIREPDVPVDELPLIAADERPLLLEGCRGISMPTPASPLPALLAARAEQHLASMAIEHGARTLRYGELWSQVHQLAQRLRGLGVTREVVVSLCLERSPEFVVAALATLATGGCYLPLDPAYPDARLELLLEDANASVLITHTVLSKRFATQRLRTVHIDAAEEVVAEALANEPAPPRLEQPLAEQAAYIIYTSGSTGTPKGVVVPHGALLNHAQAMVMHYGLGPSDRVLQFASFAFDVAIEELYPSLLAGATVVLWPDRLSAPIPEFVRFLARERITVANLPAPYWHAWVEALVRDPACAPPPSLRLVIAGSQAVSATKLAAWRELAPDVRWMNAYGPTEATITATLHEPPAGPREPQANVPIGRPIANVELYVLDDQLRLVPPGIAGEIFLGGEGLARGYRRRPDATAAAFLPHPFSRTPGARLYRTGDRGRYRHDGQVEFLGRMDRQVKVRGFRVELAEVEVALGQLAGVAEAAVLYREGPGGDGRLEAFVEPVASEPLTEQVLRERVRMYLPSHLVPAVLNVLEQMPRTPGGKPDRQALLSLPPREQEPNAQVEPDGAVERALARIWGEVLGVQHAGLHDDFFLVGGDSLLAIRLVARAREQGFQLSVRDVFERPTIAALAAHIGQRALVATTEAPTGPDFPLAPGQQRFFEHPHENLHHWNRALLVEVEEELDAEPLREAVRQVERHHEALRLRFHRNADGMRQSPVETAEQIPFSRSDLSATPTAELGSAIEAAAAREQTTLHLEHGPLWKVTLMELGPSHGQRLLVIAHFLVADAFSWTLLLEDLHAAYRWIRRGEPVRLPLTTVPFYAWAEQIMAYSESAQARHELEYWREELGGPVAALPLDTPSGANTEASLRVVYARLLNADARILVHDLPATLQVDVESVLLWALARVLCACTDGAPVLVDLGRHGRQASLTGLEVSRTIGCFTSDSPFRLELPEGDTFESLRALDARRQRMPHRGFGYGLLRYLCQDQEVAREARALPCATVSFDYLGAQPPVATAGFKLALESSGPDRCPVSPRTHQLQIIVAAQAETGLEIQWRYSEALHRRITIEKLAERYCTVLGDLASQFRESYALVTKGTPQ
ncbi:non-ribosomal peptide synthetase/type I polyketide synthase [Polyangium fumosum]|uniref:Phenolphthiocerol/phthiocerol polyketide synthase subunit E n=1 Tax=Polyangium fumosum TaxID=889272 RepID=A0A4U1IVP8_9BACT|nr:non-ribosomal peptide synthetase/type I polyketide synthase [Polyangium fumosum]TKC98587.1 amino acid adenylation domain-containing protein [Polyangium fumosum]